MLKILMTLCSLAFSPTLMAAAEFDGANLSLIWGVPFAGLLLSIALFPLFAPRFWHHHFGKVALGWAILLLTPLIVFYGVDVGVHSVFHALALEYVPFILLLLALYIVSGGIALRNRLPGTPAVCTTLLAVGTIIASLMGTTGAAMVLIRPLLSAISYRRYRVHTVVFFIFLVANIGGSLSPLGDPPLFLGFLKGVSFFWPLKNLIIPTSILSLSLLALYWIVDRILYEKEGRPQPSEPRSTRIEIDGKHNFFFLAAIVGLVLFSGLWRPETSLTVLDTELALPNLVRDAGLILVALLSLKTTPKANYAANAFSWEPILEVAKLFAAIFVAIIPVIAILRAGSDGAMAALIAQVTDAAGNPIDAAYFWLTGSLSSFLDNAPTYLVFFNMAGGDPQHLMGPFATTLEAISMGAVYMGAMTYIGNAPNFMVRSIAADNGVPMPSFFGYMLWSIGILAPLFLLLTLVVF